MIGDYLMIRCADSLSILRWKNMPRSCSKKIRVSMSCSLLGELDLLCASNNITLLNFLRN